MNELHFKKTHKDAQLPAYRDDVSSIITFTTPEATYLRYGSIEKITIGVELTISDGYELQLHPVSELAYKGVTIVNSPHTLTKGEVVVYLTSLGLEPVYISRGETVVFGVVRPIIRLPINKPKE